MARKRKALGEPFPLPLFCPECFDPINDDNPMLFPTSVNDSGVGCNSCWVNPLCPGECHGIHGGPVPRGARRNLRRYSVAGTWTCPTDEISYRYIGPNTEAGWATPHNWYEDRYDEGSFLHDDEWYESESEWHECMGHQWCDYCEEYYSDRDGHDFYHEEPDYDNDDYYEDDYGRDNAPNQPIGQWRSEATHYDPVTEYVWTGEANEHAVPIPHFESLVAA